MDSHQRIAQRVLAEHLAIANRLRADPGGVLDYAIGNVRRWSENFSSECRPRWLVDWEQLLNGPLDALIAALTADTKEGTHLRQTSPFVGLLTFQERVDILHGVDPEMARSLEAFGASWDERFPVAAKLAKR